MELLLWIPSHQEAAAVVLFKVVVFTAGLRRRQQ